jgi:hypothetical protein
MMCPADRAMLIRGYRELHKWMQMVVIFMGIVAVVDTI